MRHGSDRPGLDTSPFDRLGRLVGWGIIPLVLVMQFFDLRRGLHGGAAVTSAFLVVFAAVGLACSPWLVARVRELGATIGLGLASFVLLLVMSLASAARIALPTVNRVTVTRSIVVVPPVTSLVTLLAALGAVLATRRGARLRLLWWTAWAILASTLVAWPRALRVHHSARIATGMGGSAVYHVVLLLCGALFAGFVLDHRRPRASAVGAALSFLGLVLVGSRAGLLVALVFGLLLACWALGRGQTRWVARAAGLIVVSALLLLALVPDLRRYVNLYDAKRTLNMHTALAAWQASPSTTWFGVGSGRLWPWYALDVRMIPAPGANIVRTAYGETLTSPHSTFLAVLAELGLVGVALLLVLCGSLVWWLARLWRHGATATQTLVAMALVASIVAWLLDTYLLKNFGIAFVWWAFLTAAASEDSALEDDAQRLRGDEVEHVQ